MVELVPLATPDWSAAVGRVNACPRDVLLVVGDVMLDRYIWGDAARISQEAPVILLQADQREERLGGASSVATMLRALGARVSLAGVLGDDLDGQHTRKILREELWFWLEGLLGWLPGRLGRLIRSACYQPFIPSDGAVDVAEHTHIRMPWKLTCGRQVSIGRGSQLTCTEGITLGDDVLLGPNVLLVSNNHEWTDPDRHIRDQGLRGAPIVVGDDVDLVVIHDDAEPVLRLEATDGLLHRGLRDAQQIGRAHV